MLCKKPFVKYPVGVRADMARRNFEARDGITPFGCGQCVPCRINKSKVWQHRIALEAVSWPCNAFVTLTYNDEHLPKDLSLNPRDTTLWLKRLRSNLPEKKIRYFLVGEYGRENSRPHYHAILFNVDQVKDLEAIKASWKDDAGEDIGFSYVGNVSAGSIKYVCKYVVKNLRRPDDSRLGGRHPEYMRCSKQEGGLGKRTVQAYADRLSESPWADRVKDLSFLNYGKVRKPLGRYLTNILEERFPKARDARLERYNSYQMGLIDNHLVKENLYVDSILAEFEGKRHRVEKLHKFLERKGNL